MCPNFGLKVNISSNFGYKSQCVIIWCLKVTICPNFGYKVKILVFKSHFVVIVLSEGHN